MTIFTDALYRPIEIQRAPTRIVSLVPSITEALFTFGLGDSVVGVTRFCVEPREAVAAKAKVGGTKTLDVTQVRQLEPDLVIANVEENRPEDVRQLIAAGLNVMVTFPRTVAAGIAMMRQISEMTDSVETAHPIIEEAAAALTEARARNEARRPLRVFCPIWRNPWMSVGPDTYIHDLLNVCGGLNIFARRHERYPITDMNEVARKDPQVILLPDEPYRFGAKHVPDVTKHPYVSAVRDQRVHLIEGKHLCWYGPRIAGSLRFVQDLLWGATPDGTGIPAGAIHG
ncbi:MAG: ABC transporter substrate-binding protein [Chloroflexi bacterium]|nr:MAG: ABC transporter substrate-binding protein [Chloroflexota bacterium]